MTTGLGDRSRGRRPRRVGRGRWVVAAAAAALLVVAGCSTPEPSSRSTGSGGTSSTPATSQTASAPLSPSRTTPAAEPVPTPSSGSPTSQVATKLLVVVVENHSLAQMRAGMPFTYGLARRYGYATQYRASGYPSLPNYLVIASGRTHGVRDDGPPAQHRLSGATVFGRALEAGRTAAVYADGMTQPCQASSQGRYAVKHNPWPYFVDERSSCRKHGLPLTALWPAVTSGSLPDAGLVVPDLCHDAHDCPLATADRWVERLVTRLQTGPDWRSGRLVVVLTADEDDHRSGNRVLTVVAHPALRGAVVAKPLGHDSLARLYAEVTGTTPLGAAATAPSMAAAFRLPIGR